MSKPFQFSIGQMLVTMTLCCLGIGLFFAGKGIGANPIAAFIIVFGSGATVGCGVGALTNKPIRYAVVGGVLAIVAVVACAMWFMSMGRPPS